MRSLTVQDFLRQLKQMYPDSEIQLQYSSPFQLLVSVVLSAQTTDFQVNKVTSKLFEYVWYPGDVLNLGEKKLQEQLKPVGLYRSKARNLIRLSEFLLRFSSDFECKLKACREIYEKRGYVIPDTVAELKKLPGVGEKTAKVLMFTLYKEKVVPVDTHIHRVVNRIGMVSTKDASATSRELEKIIDDESKKFAHHVIIFFGREICKSQKPECEICPFSKYCEFYNKNRD